MLIALTLILMLAISLFLTLNDHTQNKKELPYRFVKNNSKSYNAYTVYDNNIKIGVVRQNRDGTWGVGSTIEESQWVGRNEKPHATKEEAIDYWTHSATPE